METEEDLHFQAQQEAFSNIEDQGSSVRSLRDVVGGGLDFVCFCQHSMCTLQGCVHIGIVCFLCLARLSLGLVGFEGVLMNPIYFN